MGLDEARSRVKGVLVYVVTPFQSDADLTLDEVGLRRNTQHLVDSGVRCIVACGGTGEFWSLTGDEHRCAVEAVRSAAGSDAVVIPGVGGCLAEAVHQAEHAEAVGCEAVMIFTPPGRFSEAGLVAYLKTIADRINVGVIPYLNAPISLHSLQALTTLPNVVAIKDASGDLGWFRRAIRVIPTHTNWLCEGESLALYYLLHGAAGFTSGVANFVPELSMGLYEAACHGEFARAAELQRFLDPWAELRAKPGNHVPVVKSAMDRLGMTGGPVRPPLLPLGEDDLRELDRLLASLPREPAQPPKKEPRAG